MQRGVKDPIWGRACVCDAHNFVFGRMQGLQHHQAHARMSVAALALQTGPTRPVAQPTVAASARWTKQRACRQPRRILSARVKEAGDFCTGSACKVDRDEPLVVQVTRTFNVSLCEAPFWMGR
jgi:hypothetical protein